MENDIYKTKTDLEAASTLLTKVLDTLNESVQRYEKFSKTMYERTLKRCLVYKECKDNLDFVIEVLKNYLDTHHEESSSGYTPPKITSIDDIGKYQTTAKNAITYIKPLLFMARVRENEEEIKLYQECIEKLNYVYSHIAKNQ